MPARSLRPLSLNPWSTGRPTDPWAVLARRLRPGLSLREPWGLVFAALALGFLLWAALWAHRLAAALVDSGAWLVPLGALGLALAMAGMTGRLALVRLASGLPTGPALAAAVAVSVLLGTGPLVLGTLAALSPGLFLASLLLAAATWIAAAAWRRVWPGGPSRARRRTLARPEAGRRPCRSGAAGAVARRTGGADPRWLACLQLAGIRAATATQLHRAGLRTLEDLARADDAALLAVRGIGPATLRRLRAAVSARLALEQAARPQDAA